MSILYMTVKSWMIFPGALIVLLTAGIVLTHYRRRAGIAVTAVAAALLYLSATGFVSSRLINAVQWPEPVETDPAAQAIIVLSAGLNDPSPEFGEPVVDSVTLERLRYAVHLHRQTGLPILVTGGSWQDSEKPLAAAMAASLQQDFQVPVRWIEPQALDTWQNARFSADMLAQDGISHAYLVTHAWHLPRALYAFRQAGLIPIPAGTGFVETQPFFRWRSWLPNSGSLLETGLAWHEALGAIAYRLR